VDSEDAIGAVVR